MKSISLLSFLFLVILPDESGIGDLNFENGFLSLVILNWIEDLNFENSVQKRDSRFRENDKGGGNDKTFLVILNLIGDLYYEDGFLSLVILPDESGIGDLNFEDGMQKRDSRFRENDKVEEREKGDSRFRGNDKGGGNDKRDGSDKTFFVILNWIGDLYYANCMQKRDSRFRENDKGEERKKGDSRFHGNDKMGENDKTFFVILNLIGDLNRVNGFLFLVILPDESGIGDLNFENSVQKRDSRFRENDKVGGNDKTFLVILNSIGDLYYENGFLFLVILPDESGIEDLKCVNTKFVKTLETNV